MGEATSGGYTLIEVGKARPGLVHIHADALELNRVYTPELAMCAGMPAAAAALAVLPAPAMSAWSDWRQSLRTHCEAHSSPVIARRELPGHIDMFAVMGHIDAHLPPEVVCTNGAGNFATWLHRFHPLPGLARGLRTQLAPTNGAMGYGVPAGVAAAITTGRPVLTFTGDGDFLMNGQELATASAMGAKTVVVLLNNGMYGTIRMHQEREYPSRVAGSALANPDFVGLAQAYGYEATRVTRTQDFAAAWQRAWASERGALIELVIDPEVITPRMSLSEIRAASRGA
jgi:acetolactate synthase I/II/III large subunit